MEKHLPTPIVRKGIQSIVPFPKEKAQFSLSWPDQINRPSHTANGRGSPPMYAGGVACMHEMLGMRF